MFRTSANAAERSDAKQNAQLMKQRLQSVLGYSPYAVYFGFVPLVIYLGFRLGPDPGTPEFSMMNLLPIG